MKRLITALLVPLLIGLLLPGCPGDTCETVSDCSTGQLCTEGGCVDCDKSGDCTSDYGSGATCEGGKCHPVSCTDGALGCACNEDGSCDAGECVVNTCSDCARGELGCVCLANSTCDAGLMCNGEGLCEECVDGLEGCPCDTGDTCDGELVCQSDVCVDDPCPVASLGCPCGVGETCDSDYICAANGLCAECTNDIEGCPCDSMGNCTNSLVCDSADDTCRAALECANLGCVLHQQCEEGTPGVDAVCLESCDAGYRWDGTSTCDTLNCEVDDPLSIAFDCIGQNRLCDDDIGGGAVCGDCMDGYTDEAGVLVSCRAVQTCADLGCIAEHRDCIPEAGTEDAVCGDCQLGFTDEGGVCVEATCDPGVTGSIADTCATQQRACVDPFDGSAHCGDCLPGYFENSAFECQAPHSCAVDDLDCAGQLRTCEGEAPLQYCGDCLEGTNPDPGNPTLCVAPVTCAEAGCGADQFCTENAPSLDASCVDSQCTDGQAYFEAESRCVDCVVNCSAMQQGETGRIWPFTKTGSEHCICETEPGFFWDEGQRSGAPCDLDGDGWLRVAARSAVESTDPTLKENARCDLHSVDRFVLENELGQRLSVYLCQGGEPMVTDPALCAAPMVLPLYETVRNDNQTDLDASNYAPDYLQGGVGRRFRTAELNSLTKACVNLIADFNDNGTSDLSEWHGMALSDLESTYVNFSYYVELHRGWYETGTSSLFVGQYVIQERPRCDENDFVLGYADPAGPYWRACTRSRAASYDMRSASDGSELGLDFARWSCDSMYGTCPVPPPPSDMIASGEVPEHGLCRDPALPPPIEDECRDGTNPWPCVGGQVWRGMSHHSQFRCVQVESTVSTETPNIPASEFLSRDFDLNQCHVVCPPGDLDCAVDCSSGSCATSSEPVAATRNPANPSHPMINCDVKATPATADVGFAAVGYASSMTGYDQGCIDEWAPTAPGNFLDPVLEAVVWRTMCPGWTEDPMGSIGEGNPANFGELVCGCGTNYGGPDCDIGCPDAQLMTSVGYDTKPRTGYWMCADFMSTGYATLDATYGPALVGTDSGGGTYVLRDDFAAPVDGQPLCEDADCGSGWVLR